MSSILKALEKAEESNSSKRIAAEHDMIRARRARPGWVLPSAVIGGAGVAALLTFLAMGGLSRHSVSQTTALRAPTAASAPVPAPAGQAVSPAPAPVVAAPANPAPLAAASAAPPASAKANSTVTITAAPVPVKAAPVAKTAVAPFAAKGAPSVKVGASKQPVTVQQPAAVQAVPVAPPAAPPAAAPAPVAASGKVELKVSGVAWQGNGESSFAVVNGRGVLQGGTVDGYKVLEIRPDRVRFQGGSGTFEVPVDEER